MHKGADLFAQMKIKPNQTSTYRTAFHKDAFVDGDAAKNSAATPINTSRTSHGHKDLLAQFQCRNP